MGLFFKLSVLVLVMSVLSLYSLQGCITALLSRVKYGATAATIVDVVLHHIIILTGDHFVRLLFTFNTLGLYRVSPLITCVDLYTSSTTWNCNMTQMHDSLTIGVCS